MNLLPRLRVVGAFFVLCVVLAAPPAFASPTLDRIKARNAIVLAYRAGTPPFSFKDRDGHVRGYSVDLCVRVAELVARQIGRKDLRIEWLQVEADARMEAVQSGRADAECGTTTVTLSRMERVDFSLPIFVDGAQ